MNRAALVIALVSFAMSAPAAVPKKTLWRPSVESVVEMLKMTPEARSVALAQQPDSVYEALLDISADNEQSMNVRWRALTSAALLRKEKAVPDLLKAAKSEQWFMRNAALVGLAEFAPKKSVDLARDLIKDKALVVRSAAVGVLAKHGSADERYLLWSELKAPYNLRGGQSLWIRGQIVKALAEKPTENETMNFASLLSEKDENLQTAAMTGLERLTGLKLGEGLTNRPRVVQLWKNYFKIR